MEVQLTGNDRYLWVEFQMLALCSERTDKAILKALKSLPKDLSETFSRILKRIERSKNIDTLLYKKILGIVAAAQRLLQLGEPREARH